MNEILVENEPGKEAEDDLTLMQELNTTLRAMQERVTQLIGRVQDEIILGKLSACLKNNSLTLSLSLQRVYSKSMMNLTVPLLAMIDT